MGGGDGGPLNAISNGKLYDILRQKKLRLIDFHSISAVFHESLSRYRITLDSLFIYLLLLFFFIATS